MVVVRCLSSSSLLAEGDVDEVPCSEEALERGGRPGLLVRMARYDEKDV